MGALRSGSTRVDEGGITPRLAKVQITSARFGSSASNASTRVSFSARSNAFATRVSVFAESLPLM